VWTFFFLGIQIPWVGFKIVFMYKNHPNFLLFTKKIHHDQSFAVQSELAGLRELQLELTDGKSSKTSTIGSERISVVLEEGFNVSGIFAKDTIQVVRAGG